MRINVPRAVHACQRISCQRAFVGYQTDSIPSDQYILGVYPIGYSVPWEDNSFIWNTHHQPMNDCVHTKLVNEADLDVYPHLIHRSTGAYYTHSVYGHSGLEFMEDPTDLKPGQQPHIRTIPSELVYCDEQLAVRCVWNQYFSSYTGTTSMPVDLYLYYCTPERVAGRLVVVNLWIQLQIKMKWTAQEVSNIPPNIYYHVSGQYMGYSATKKTGGRSNILRDYPVEHLASVIGAYLSGGTYYYRYRAGWTRMPFFVAPNCEAMLDAMKDYLLTIPVGERRSKWKNWSYLSYDAIDLDLPELVPAFKRFLLHEDARIMNGDSALMIDGSGLGDYWFDVLTQQAYLDTLNNVPTLNDNSISNVLEIAGFIKSLLIDHKVDLPKSLGDAWLSYRYQYTTSKLDAEEAISFVHRYRDLGTLDQFLHCFGASSITYSNGEFEANITCRCGLRIRPKDIAILGKVWRSLYTYGLQPNFYVVWDSIPYSFIIDWLIPIGNMAHALDAESMYSDTYYEIKDVVFSISYDLVDEYQNQYHQYTRFVSDGIPQLNGFYFLEEDPATSRVKGMRALDVASLLIGKVKKK